MPLSLTPKKKLALTGAFALVMVTLALVVGISLNILRTQSTTSFARGFSAVIPVPAARVSGRFLRYDDVLTRWDAIDAFIRSAPTSTDQGTIPPLSVLRQEAYEQGIRETFVSARADAEGFELPEAAVQANLDQLILRSSSTVQEVEQEMKVSLGWSLEEFTDRVVRPATLEEALVQHAIAANASTTAELWRAELDGELQTDKVVRYLRF